MKNLTNYQKKFILKFFENNDYAGWKNIATKLLETGECIVPGDFCIWSGGIGNFIKTEEYEDAVGCLKYSFDLENFLSSKWYAEVSESHISTLSEEISQKTQEYDEIKSLTESSSREQYEHSLQEKFISTFIEKNKNKVPILRGCKNAECFCTGTCREIVGYRDKVLGER